ncbi:MAG: N-acetylmuramoyl-L-alanine amidase [Clostridia bacterium]|nr:N-acetylmuramoyl-L-alanine amidase [Clostridia bacterium]
MKIKKQYIMPGALKRPQIRQSPKYLTIHSTGNAKSTAQNEHDWLMNPTNNRQASFHIVVDEKEAIACIPFNEVAYHAGDGQGNGNRASIGMEICESGDRQKTLANAAKLAAFILGEYGWNANKMVQHNHWSGKDCPRILRNQSYIKNKMNWAYFVSLVKKELAELQKQKLTIALPEGRQFTVMAINDNGSNYVQLRPVLEALGYKVAWQKNRISIGK